MAYDPVVPSSEDTAVAFGGPAVAVSNFMVHPLAPSVLRLSFIEAPYGGIPQYRAAVILTPEGARNLAELLMRFAPPREDAGG